MHLIQLLTAITGWFAELLAGAFLLIYFGLERKLENHRGCTWKTGLPGGDGSVLLSACIFILINILADVLYAVVDPRVRVG